MTEIHPCAENRESPLQLVPSAAELALGLLCDEFRIKVENLNPPKYPEPLELDE